ncbi:MAG TPA: DUF4198 domain-containing protein [Caulobacterales bacterium]|nr:DUF4198 domain-containing protein [Caulobacterales bacterium]
MRLFLAACVATLLLTSAAHALTAYVLPRDFSLEASETTATVEAAYGDQFFAPSIGLSSPDFRVVQPNGARVGFAATDVNAQRGIYTLATQNEGTYRVTTGEILGAVTTMVAVDGEWRPLAAGETPPEGADTTTLQTATVAETYITKVRPDAAAYATPVGRLAIVPVTHPNRVSLATGFEVQLLFDGQPMGNMAIVLYAAGDPETKLDRFVTTDANGHATFTFTQPGPYVAVVRHRTNAPEGAGVTVRSYTTSLAFEVLQTLPPIPPPPPEDRRRRNNDRWRF